MKSNLFILTLILVGLLMPTPLQADSFRKTITSASRDIRVETLHLQNGHYDMGTKAKWSVRKYTLHGGKQEGVDLIVVNNGRLSFTVIPTRGMGVLRADSEGVRLGWDSPVKEVVHPQYINHHSRGGLGWLEGFNEWMVRCGLEFAGHPGKDKFINNVGDEAEMELTLHGKIGNIPASEVEILIERDPRPRIRIRGRVDERMFYGPKLELWTEISTEPGSNSFTIEDEVKNHGAFDQEMQIIYHANYGPPLLGAGSRFLGAVKQVTPFNEHAARSVATYDTYEGPAKGFIEQVYCLTPYADAHDRTLIMLHDFSRTRAVTMAYSVSHLPYLTLWKNTTALDEGYVTGLEPGTGFPYNRRLERLAGRVPKLKPGETRRFMIEFGILSKPEEVAGAVSRIATIQAGRKTQVEAAHRRPE